MKIIAHRGASFEAPENTLAAMRLAIDQKSDGVEFDIHRTRDGKAAVIHDDSTLRTTGMRAWVRDMSMDELRLLDAGGWKGPRWGREAIPELGDVLRLLPEDMLAFIEIKCGPDILPAVAEAVPLLHEQSLFVGFSLDTMALAKQQFPDHKALWNLELLKDEAGAWRPETGEMAAAVRGAGLDGVGLGFCDAITGDLVAAIHEAGLEVFVWTVDDVEQAKRMRSLNVDYLATHRPGALRAGLG